jgi:hypothetical protein
MTDYEQGQSPFGAAVQPVNQAMLFLENFERGSGPAPLLPPALGFAGMDPRWIPFNPNPLTEEPLLFVDCNRKLGCVATLSSPAFDHAWAGARVRLPPIVIADGATRYYEIQSRVCPLFSPMPMDLPAVAYFDTFAGFTITPDVVGTNFIAAGFSWRQSPIVGVDRITAEAHHSKWLADGGFPVTVWRCAWAPTLAVYVRMVLVVSRVGADYTTSTRVEISADGMSWCPLTVDPLDMIATTPPSWIGIGCSGSNQGAGFLQGSAGIDFLRMRELSFEQYATSILLAMGGQNWP